MPHAEVKTIETPSTVQGIGEARNPIADYVRVHLLLAGKLDIGEPVLADLNHRRYTLSRRSQSKHADRDEHDGTGRKGPECVEARARERTYISH